MNDKEDRSVVLLRACLDLLLQYKESPFELETLGMTVQYDDAVCDGYCLIDDLQSYLIASNVLSSDNYDNIII